MVAIMYSDFQPPLEASSHEMSSLNLPVPSLSDVSCRVMLITDLISIILDALDYFKNCTDC